MKTLLQRLRDACVTKEQAIDQKVAVLFLVEERAAIELERLRRDIFDSLLDYMAEGLDEFAGKRENDMQAQTFREVAQAIRQKRELCYDDYLESIDWKEEQPVDVEPFEVDTPKEATPKEEMTHGSDQKS